MFGYGVLNLVFFPKMLCNRIVPLVQLELKNNAVHFGKHDDSSKPILHCASFFIDVRSDNV